MFAYVQVNKGLNVVAGEYVQLNGSVAPSSQLLLPNRCAFCDAHTSSLAGFRSYVHRRHAAYAACSVGAHALPRTQMRVENSGLTLPHKQLHNRSHSERAGLSECAQPR